MKKALTGKPLIALLSITAVAAAADKEKPKFSAGPVTDYPCRQTIEKITIAAAPFSQEADTQKAFGKLNPNRYGVLPVLVVIQNDSDKAITLDKVKVELITPLREHVEATPASDIRYLQGPDRPKVYTGPLPRFPTKTGKKKNPLNAWEIEGRAFAARMLAPKESATGFFYFRAPYQGGSSLYLSGMREAASGKEIFYFEIPLDKSQSERPVKRPTRAQRAPTWPPLGIPAPILAARPV